MVAGIASFVFMGAGIFLLSLPFLQDYGSLLAGFGAMLLLYTSMVALPLVELAERSERR